MSFLRNKLPQSLPTSRNIYGNVDYNTVSLNSFPRCLFLSETTLYIPAIHSDLSEGAWGGAFRIKICFFSFLVPQAVLRVHITTFHITQSSHHQIIKLSNQQINTSTHQHIITSTHHHIITSSHQFLSSPPPNTHEPVIISLRVESSGSLGNRLSWKPPNTASRWVSTNQSFGT